MSFSQEDVFPVALKKQGDEKLLVEWSDGQRRLYRWSELRESCPCAMCRDERSRPAPLLPLLSPAQAQPPRPKAMHPVGRYAYQIEWNDGHDAGIYSFSYLRQLGVPVPGEQRDRPLAEQET
ncbi:MAG: DUF971 domain-containing protein [Planctomycetes bacterium]|nr:DUF971 domain-containing protein [Planctomycetota bacterium]